MKATHAKFGNVEILKVENKFATVKLESGEVKQLMTFVANLTDENGNKIDLEAMNVMKEIIVAANNVGKKESKTAAMLAEMNDYKQFNHMTKSYK